jgi:hypothetical protein
MELCHFYRNIWHFYSSLPLHLKTDDRIKPFVALCISCRLVEKHLGQFVDEKKAKQLEARSLPLEGCAVVAGRTDKGVTALQQVCSFC